MSSNPSPVSVMLSKTRSSETMSLISHSSRKRPYHRCITHYHPIRCFTPLLIPHLSHRSVMLTPCDCHTSTSSQHSLNTTFYRLSGPASCRPLFIGILIHNMKGYFTHEENHPHFHSVGTSAGLVLFIEPTLPNLTLCVTHSLTALVWGQQFLNLLYVRPEFTGPPMWSQKSVPVIVKLCFNSLFCICSWIGLPRALWLVDQF